ncbi:MAG TPA: response regulator [Chthoniobacterales bacterium]
MKIDSNNVPNAIENTEAHQNELWPEESSWHHRLSEAFRTRLNAIIGFSELLGLEPLSSNARSDLKQILKAARDLLEVTNRELSVAPGNLRGQHSNAAPAGERTCQILYIEDDIANVTLVERILELRPGLSLKHATHGQLGMEMARAENPKLILLDLNLPDIHGSDVLKNLQNNPQTSQIPVVILSANAIPTQIERLLAAGARNYLTKPFELDHFLAVIDEWTTA